MKNIITITFLFLVLLSLQSCFIVKEELWLEKDGSGKFVYSVDFKPILNDFMIGPILLDGLKEDTSLLKPLIAGRSKLDTTVKVLDAFNLAKSKGYISTGEAPEIFSQASLKLQFDERERIFITDWMLDFGDITEISQFLFSLSSLNETQDLGVSFPGISGFSEENPLFELREKKLIRKKLLNPVFDEEEEEEVEESLMDKEFSDLFKGFGDMAKGSLDSGESSYTMIYHFPKKIKKSSFSEADIKGKTLSMKYKMSDMILDLIDTGGSIEYK